ncbi:response regulator [Gallaecimonas sp. GXIMD4217]|uniref:response regulator n=1 Tax=Gallaecimonas sp. GXIMD4217 TaxID=3131927 RepID=UPI00311B123E
MHSLSPADLVILLVEPSATQRRIISNNLAEEAVHQVDCATGLADALARLAESRPDLVLSSLHFEDGSALELVRAMGRDPELAKVPFMLVTSEQRPAQLEAFKQSGVVALLPKPFSREQLGRALNATLDLLSPDELELSHFDVQSLRVLVVDDSRLARRHIKRVLENLGVSRITEAEDGAQAQQLLGLHMFDLVVTDYNMPHVNGRELAEHIRSQSQQSHLPILMVTSEANGAHLANITQAGINAICDKPFEPMVVKEMLYRLLND